ncbi:MAG: polyprenyl diphosphate synthase [Endozoicomonadaceae bacterium]|nr:polyprenyl diphosphate synthase [Endozoicomonadaceae bacterium]
MRELRQLVSKQILPKEDSTNDTSQPILAERLPQHVAVIMDGNNRWAKRNKLKQLTGGHRAGIKAVRTVIECCRDYNIKTLSLFAFSSENWGRPKKEVNALMELFLVTLQQEVKTLHKNGIRLKIIGNTSAFSSAIQESIAKAESMTCTNDQFTLIIAANYGGQWDIAQSARQLAYKVQSGELHPDQITEDLLQQHLATENISPPDLLIRTGGECRLSNFMLWQSAYTELYFTNTLWPDFDQKTFYKAMLSYASRQRRFGLLDEQTKASCSLSNGDNSF